MTNRVEFLRSQIEEQQKFLTIVKKNLQFLQSEVLKESTVDHKTIQ